MGEVEHVGWHESSPTGIGSPQGCEADRDGGGCELNFYCQVHG